MSQIATQLRNAAKFGSPVAPGEREKAAETIEKLVEALKHARGAALDLQLQGVEQRCSAKVGTKAHKNAARLQVHAQALQTELDALLRELGEAS